MTASIDEFRNGVRGLVGEEVHANQPHSHAGKPLTPSDEGITIPQQHATERDFLRSVADSGPTTPQGDGHARPDQPAVVTMKSSVQPRLVEDFLMGWARGYAPLQPPD